MAIITRCEHCGNETAQREPHQDMASGWLLVVDSYNGLHFCSYSCLSNWSATAAEKQLAETQQLETA